MTLTKRIGTALLALAALVPATTYAQNSRLGWVVGPLVSKQVDQGFFGPIYGLVPESVGKPLTFAPGETIARAQFRCDGCGDSESSNNNAVLTYAGTDGEQYLVELTCNASVGYESSNSVMTQRALSTKRPTFLSLRCSNMPENIIQSQQKIELRMLNIDEHGNATIDARVLPRYTEKPR